jgi:hypothetical protein
MKTKTRRTSTTKLRTNGSNGALEHNEIAFGAYCIWEQEGRPQDHDVDHWLRAERLLRQAHQSAERAAAS